MMLCLALRSSPQQVYQQALQQFTVGEITEAFAAARGLALPSQLRKLMRAQGRNLHAEFVRLLPEPPRPIGVQRWSTRRVVLLALVLLALIPAVPLAWAFARSSANPGGAAAVTGGNGACTQIEELWPKRSQCRRPPASPASGRSRKACSARWLSAMASRCSSSATPALTSTSAPAGSPKPPPRPAA